MNGEMIDLENKQILDAIRAISSLGAMQIPSKPAYWMGKNLNRLNSFRKKIEQERTKIIEKYGVADKKAGVISIPQTIGEEKKHNPDLEKADAEYQEILKKTNRVEIIKIRIDLLEKINISAAADLEFMFVE